MNTVPLLTLAALPWLFAAPATSQVVISEINFSAHSESDDQWVELVNLGGESVELNGWSLYLATGTPAAIGNYWFGIPNLELEPGDFMRVHWLAPIPASPGAKDIYTGVSILNFLFGYYAVPLPASGGALAVLSTQNNQLMNTPAVIEDWVSWGGNGYPREDLAVQADKWTVGASVAAPIAADSIALIQALEPLPGEGPTPVSAYFHDAFPTPNMPNATGGSLARFGTSCAGTNLTLQAQSVPAAGNRDFQLRLDNTLGLPNEFAALVLSLHPGNGSFEVLGCPIWIDLAGAQSLLIPTAVGQTVFPFNLSIARPILAGLELDFQGAVVDFSGPGTLETTDALHMILGN